MQKWFSRLRNRLLVVVLLAALPALILILFTGVEQRAEAAQQAQEDALRIVGFAAVNQELLVENSRGFLVALAHLAGLNKGDLTDCAVIFAHLQESHYPYYTGFYLADLEGNVLCSTPGESPDHLDTCPHYQNLIRSSGFTVSTYHLCRTSGKGVISLGYPVINDQNQPIGVVNVGIDLEWFNTFAEDANLSPGSTLTVTDQDGIILAHYPDPEYWVGKKMPEDGIHEFISTQNEGTARALGPDGMERLYAFTPLWSETQRVYVSLGIPISVAFAEANRTMTRNLAFLVLATLLVGVGAWYLSGLFLVKQTQALVDTTQRLASGELQTRTNFPYQEGEMGMLAQAIDKMAQSLEERDDERRLAEEALSEYAIDLEHRNRELQDFANIASHDLQEPLRKIQIFSDLLIRRYIGELDDRACFYLQSMNESANRMQGLLRDLLSYSQITSRGKPFTRTDLVEVVHRVTKDLDYQIESSAANIEIKSLPVIEADPTQMYQLFQNLLGNALKFHKPGQNPVITVSTKNCEQNQLLSGLKKSDDHKVCEIVVKDEGIGFDEKYLERIFQPFERLHSVGEYEGTGMGLAICRKIVERHGGSISASSAPGKGASFIIHLPTQQKEEGTHDKQTSHNIISRG